MYALDRSIDHSERLEAENLIQRSRVLAAATTVVVYKKRKQQIMPKTMPSSSLDDLSENVKKLQDKLRDTQSSMHRICQRANELKERVSLQKHQQANNESIQQQQQQQQTEQQIVKQREQIDELSQTVEKLTKERNFWQDKSQLNEQEQETLNNKIHSLETHNTKLKNAVETYEKAVQAIATKSAHKLKTETQQLKQHVNELQQQLSQSEQENYNLHQNNMQLKSVVQTMINVMRAASTQRDTELIESREAASTMQLHNLRALLKISEEFGSLDEEVVDA